MTTSETPPTETSLLVRPINWLRRRFKEKPDLQSLDEDLPVTDTVELLAADRRQAILEALVVTTQPVSTATLAERVACAEYDCTTETLESEQRKRVYIALKQSHLPVLDEANVVKYNADTNRVARGPQFSHLWKTYISVVKSLS